MKGFFILKNNLEIWNRVYTFVRMKAKEPPKEKRFLRGYKIANSNYDRAMKRAKKDKYPLATFIEEWVTNYGKYGTFINEPKPENNAKVS